MMKLGLKCNKCGDVIYTKGHRDFHRCKCGACFIDECMGGLFRYGGKDEDYKVVECILDKSGNLLKIRNKKGDK